MHDAAILPVQVAMTSHPPAITQNDTNALQLAWIEEVKAPGVRLALH
jgi:hypothetical protein